MTLQEIQNQALKLPMAERWQLVQSLLSSIQQEIQQPSQQKIESSAIEALEPWTQSLVGVIQLEGESPIELYSNYLEEKYR